MSREKRKHEIVVNSEITIFAKSRLTIHNIVMNNKFNFYFGKSGTFDVFRPLFSHLFYSEGKIEIVSLIPGKKAKDFSLLMMLFMFIFLWQNWILNRKSRKRYNNLLHNEVNLGKRIQERSGEKRNLHVRETKAGTQKISESWFLRTIENKWAFRQFRAELFYDEELLLFHQ